MKYYFPFGEELKPLRQQDRTPKKVFVLGVYASAVHARWATGPRHSRWDRYLSHSSFKLKYLSPLLLLYCIAIVLYDWF